MRFALALLLACPAFAVVEGVVLNETTGQAQSGVDVLLVQPGAGGMKSLGSAKSGPTGLFKIDQDLPAGPALLQSTYAGVTYTQALPPGSVTSGLRVNVYNSTKQPPPEMITQHLVLLEPTATELHVSETFFTRNLSKLTFQDTENGSIRLYLPQGAPANLQVTIDSTGVPIRRPLEKGKQAGAYKVGYPLKPGETRFDLEYSLPATATLSGKVFSTTPPTKLVTPAGVTLSGNGLTDLGEEPETKARVYTFTGDSYKVGILGVGSIRPPAADTGAPAEDTGAPKCCQEVPARVNQQMPWVLGLGFGILLLGGTLLYRRGQVGPSKA
ncbi:MAG: hypothetical protein ABI811_01995 [Acidobacteriota bacterium]